MSDMVQRARQALSNATVADAIRELDHASRDREVRRQMREPLRSGRCAPPRCGGCQRWLRSTRQRCDCGFNNDVRGPRNLGGYTG